jgi:hypothetical protein
LCQWGSIAVVRDSTLFGRIAILQFGKPVIGALTVSAHIADKLAHAAGDRWPEAGPFPEETRGDVFRRLFKEWAVITGLVSLFFIVVAFVIAPHETRPSISDAFGMVLFPAIVVAVVVIVEFIGEKG